MSRLDELAERIERLALRHEELRRTNELLEQQLAAVTSERDSLRSRLAAARGRAGTTGEPREAALGRIAHRRRRRHQGSCR